MESQDATEGSEAGEPGLARERTDLAWNRSGLAVTVTVAIVLRRLWPLHGDREIIALALIAVGAVTWVVGLRLGRRIGRAVGAGPALGEPALRMLTIGTVVLALSGVVIGLL